LPRPIAAYQQEERQRGHGTKRATGCPTIPSVSIEMSVREKRKGAYAIWGKKKNKKPLKRKEGNLEGEPQTHAGQKKGYIDVRLLSLLILK